MSTLTILVMGKGGVGKSSTVNSIIGERAVTVSPFQVYAAFFLSLLWKIYFVLPFCALRICIYGFFVVCHSRKGQGLLWFHDRGLDLL